MTHNTTGLSARVLSREQTYQDAGKYILVAQQPEELWQARHCEATGEAREPPRVSASIYEDCRPCIGRFFVQSNIFQTFIAFVIICNCIVMGFETDYPAKQELWMLLERICLGVFTFELTMRLLFLGSDFFRGSDWGWNTFDSVVVAAGLIDTVLEIFDPVDTEEELTLAGHHRRTHRIGAVSVMFRAIRLMRILRVFRLFRVLTQLYMLVMSFMEAVQSVVWVSVLAGVYLFLCAVFLTRMLGQPLGADALDSSDLDASDVDHAMFYKQAFGTIPQSMLTLFQLMATPDLRLVQTAIDHSLGVKLFFVSYVVFGSFALLSILTGVISESMVSKGQVRRENMRFEEEARLKAVRQRLREHFKEYDESGDGLLSRAEFSHAIPSILQLLKEQSGEDDAIYTEDDLIMVFDLMDLDGGGELDVEEFLKGMEQFDCRIHQVPLQIMKFQAAVMKKHNDLRDEVKGVKQQLNDIHSLLIKGQAYR